MNADNNDDIASLAVPRAPTFATLSDEQAEGYRLYRGRCKELSEAACKADPTLRLARGHVFIAQWGTDEQHWWCVKSDGTIYDPSVKQFPSTPHHSLYTEFDGRVECSQCGKEGDEKDFSFDSNYCFCSHRCHGMFVGIF